jgi:hypothetical protein
MVNVVTIVFLWVKSNWVTTWLIPLSPESNRRPVLQEIRPFFSVIIEGLLPWSFSLDSSSFPHISLRVFKSQRTYLENISASKWINLSINICRPNIFTRVGPAVIFEGKKVKLSPVTGRGGPQGCETSRLPHFLDNRLTDGSEVVSLSRLPPLPPGRFLLLISVRGWVDNRAHSAAGRIRSI